MEEIDSLKELLQKYEDRIGYLECNWGEMQLHIDVLNAKEWCLGERHLKQSIIK